jgi:hypothetical protein
VAIFLEKLEGWLFKVGGGGYFFGKVRGGGYSKLKKKKAIFLE